MPRPPSGRSPNASSRSASSRNGRRPNGDGSFRVRKDGRIEATIRLDGKRHSVYGRNKTEAKAKLDELRKKHSKGVNLSSKNQTVGEFLEEYLREVAAPHLRPRTYLNNQIIVKKYIAPELGTIQLQQLTPQHIQRVINSIDKAPNTIRNIRNVFRKALSIALDWNLIEYNPAERVRIPKIERETPRVFSLEELHQFMKQIEGHRLEGLYLLAIYTGARQGELLGIRKQDTDLEQRIINIKGQIQYIEGKPQWTTTKTDESKRTIPIPTPAFEPIRRIYDEYPSVEFLFPSTTGTTPIGARNLIRQFKQLLINSGLDPAIKFHTFRYTAATYLVHSTDLKTAMSVLGHSQASTTLTIYAQTVPEKSTSAVQTMVETINGSQKR